LISYTQADDWIWQQTADLPNFKSATIAWWQGCLSLARGLVQLFALALDLPENYFDEITSFPGSDGLYIRYPGTSATDRDTADVGIGSHTDMQCFTLLWQDNSGGLQVLSSQDEWLEATPVDGTLVVNIADFMQRLSNNKFRSTVHRVYNKNVESRYSMALFFGFNADAECAVVETCVDDKHPPLYEPITCGKVRR
jgi:isopenicillin N synthase-like dioxygenase